MRRSLEEGVRRALEGEFEVISWRCEEVIRGGCEEFISGRYEEVIEGRVWGGH